MRPLTILLLLPLTAAFEIAYVLEPFEPIADVALEADLLSEIIVDLSTIADGVQVGSSVNASLTPEAMFGDQALNVTLMPFNKNSTSSQRLSLQSLLENRTHKCHGAQELSLWYQFQLEEEDVQDWRIFLLLEQHPLSKDLETWEYHVQEDYNSFDSNTWQESRVPLHLFRPSEKDAANEISMDLNRIKGWRMELKLKSSSSATLLFDQLSFLGGGDLLGSSFYEGSWDEAEKDKGLQATYHSSNISRDETKEVLSGDGTFAVNYTLEQRETWGGYVQYQHIPPSRAYYNLSTAQAISFLYDTTQVASVLGRAHLRLILLDGSDCVEGCDYPADGLENYYSFHRVLDRQEKGQVSLELNYGDSGDGFVWDGWFGIVGNSQLDKQIVKGFKLEFSVDSQGDIGSLVSGSVTLSKLMATETFGNETIDSEVCTVEPDLRIRDFHNTFRRIEFVQGHGECCQVCKEDPTCYYAVIHRRDCYIKDAQIAPQDVELRNDKLLLPNTLVFVKETEETAGNFCQRCHCDEKTGIIDCRGQDLVFSPISFKEAWSPRKLDLRNNPRLVILSSTALKDLPSLSELLLPTNLTFIPPNIVETNKRLEQVVFEHSPEAAIGRSSALNAITSSTERFGDICCGRGESLSLSSTKGASELTICDLKEDQPGIDAVYENFTLLHQATWLRAILPSSPFMFEAAESPEKCAEYCHIDSDCKYFQYDARLTASEHSCILLSDKGTPMHVCCDREHFRDPELKSPGWVAGYVPQTRNEVDNARVLVKPSSPRMEATESNGYQATYLVSLGAMPLRGAVWVEPRVATAAGMKLSFSPPLVVLYDNETVTEVIITVTNAAESVKGGTVVVTSVVEACDAAFLTSNTCSASDDLAIYLTVVKPSSADVVTLAVVIPLSILLLAAVALWALSEFKRRKDDSIWQIKKEELRFEDPPKVFARGRFGNVLLAEWRGTVVAVKRVIPPDSAAQISKHGANSKSLRNEAFDKNYSVVLSNNGGSSVGASRMVEGSGNFGVVEEDVELGSFQTESSRGRPTRSSPSSVCSPWKKRSSFLRASIIFDEIRKRQACASDSHSMSSSVTAGTSRQKFWERTFEVKLDDYASLQANFVEEMKCLSRLRHPCIISLMGAVIEPNKEPMLVMEYMEFGSLKDLLQNQTFRIDEEQLLPILHDITQGCRFLHGSGVCHCDLKAKNILVDSRLRAKVADFGLSQSKKKRLGATGTPYWMAPELLRGESNNTVQSDAFSFGVILFECYGKADPYEGEDLFQVLDEIIDPRVKKRPPVPPECDEKIQRMMKNCFEDIPSLRPTFEQMDIQLREMKVDFVSPCDLQRKASEGNPETMDVLEEMFPSHVASALREGRKVEPESKEMTTILFMDVVGFTRISSALSPIQVSNMLQRLYTKFDALSQDYDVFKVETISDSWMGVTNLTKDQSNDHVKRIADFASAAMLAASETCIDEENEDLGCVKMRGGFHSGPVVANVCSRNRRYCLFGDTVTTASRMERHSEAGKIQCSDVSASLLEEQDPSRFLHPRGLQHIKGKGLMMTFWAG